MPQTKHPPRPEDVERIHVAKEALRAAEEELKTAVADALKRGGSIAETAKAAGLSTNTVQRWGRERGWPTKAQREEWDRPRREREELYEKLGLTEAVRLLSEQGLDVKPRREP